MPWKEHTDYRLLPAKAPFGRDLHWLAGLDYSQGQQERTWFQTGIAGLQQQADALKKEKSRLEDSVGRLVELTEFWKGRAASLLVEVTEWMQASLNH